MDKPLLPQEGEGSSRKACKQDKKNLAPNAKFLGGSLLTNIMLFILGVAVIISPKHVSDNTARICSTLMAGLMIYLSTDVFCLTNGFIVYCGDISYVLYLVHWPIIAAARYYVDSQTLSSRSVAIVLFASFMLSVAIHHTLEKFFEKNGVLIACLCVFACYACILGTKSTYLYAPPLESIDPNISKIDYAIEWNMIESHKVYFAMPCSKDDDTQRYTNYKKWPQMRCVAKGNATVKVLMIGNSIAYRAYPLIHDILKGRYRSFRLYSRSACPPLSNWCPDFTEAMRKVVQHEKPDIILYMHLSVYAPFVAPVEYPKKDRIYKEFQGNIDFIRYTKHIVIDMPYYKPSFNTGAKLARRLQLGLSPGDEFVVTWEQHINQTRYHQLRLNSLNCSKCIMNGINQALFKDGLFHLYDPDTLLSRIGDGIHMTPVGLELLRPLYTKILENLLQRLTN